MTKKKDGGPAFPELGGQFHGDLGEIQSYGGATMRDYFAARAPLEIPTWFFHDAPKKPEKPRLPEDSNWGFNEDEIRIAKSWLADDCFDLSCVEHPEDKAKYSAERLEAFEITWKLYWETRAQYEDQNQRARFIQWRWHYADAMLAEREK